MREQNIIQQIFRSEITWIISIIGFIWSFVATVVMPIQALQINVTKIQEQLTLENGRYLQNEIRIGTLERNQAVVMEKLSIKKN